MDTNLPVSRHFFKVMMPGFLTKLILPPVFCKRFGLKKSSEATLTSCKGSWKVEIGECREEKLCFGAGWHEFARSHELDVGDFAVFEHKGSMHFQVSMFGPSCCEKEFPEAVCGEKRKRSNSPDESSPGPQKHRVK
ncbi:hypothetical protein NMG60_11016352, partial [Bertholletia excelsa]